MVNFATDFIVYENISLIDMKLFIILTKNSNLKIGVRACSKYMKVLISY